MGYVGPAPVASSITSSDIADDAVNSDQIAAGAVDAAHMSVNSIDSDSYVDGSIDNAHLADDAVNSDEIAAGSIDTAHIANDQITNALMADDAIGVAQLSATGTASSTTFLRGDNAWVAVSTPKLDSPVIAGALFVNDSGTVSHTISNYSDDISYTITPTNCSVGSVSSSGVFVVTHTSGNPSYTIQATTDSLGLDDSAVVTKTIVLNLSAPTLSSPANAATSTNVVYTITSTHASDDKLILDIGASTFTYQSVSVGSGAKVGNTVEVTGFTTNNPAVTIQFTAEGVYSITAKAVKIDGSFGDSDSSAADPFTCSNFDPTDPYDYGNGSDGVVAASGGDATTLSVVDTYLSNAPSSGQATCTVNSTTGFAAGDKVLLIQSQKSAGLTDGTHEYLEIQGIASTTITFTSNLQNAYSNSPQFNMAQMVRVNEYSAVTLASDFVVPAYDGEQGGIFVAKCSGTFALSAKINATGKGYRGGTSANVGYGAASDQGESQIHGGSNSTSANGCSGGGGRMNVPGTLSAKSGGGGGHAAAGANGSSLAVGGALWGDEDLTDHLGFGGSGGAGGYDYGSAGGHGGAGGGIIVIMAHTLTLSGSGELEADGGAGTGNSNNNQGSGAGGSIYVKSGVFTTNNACNAGAGATATYGSAGSVGRIHVQVDTLTGTTSPTAYTG